VFLRIGICEVNYERTLRRKKVPDRRTGQQIKLQDGRTLGYAEYGPPEGKPIFGMEARTSMYHFW
jgi:hypothetical protein